MEEYRDKSKRKKTVIILLCIILAATLISVAVADNVFYKGKSGKNENNSNNQQETKVLEETDKNGELSGQQKNETGTSESVIEETENSESDTSVEALEVIEENGITSEAQTNSNENSDSETADAGTVTVGIAKEINTGAYQTATIVMVGDVLLHTPVSESGLMADGTYNYDHLFANVKSDISGADLAIVNQEVILGGRELGLSGYPTFNGAYEVGDSLVDAGFDVVLHATNHALDKGKTGILNCLNYWRTSHPEIGVLGINDSYEQQNRIYVVNVNGIRIAILNYTYGTNGIPMPADMPYAVNLIDTEKIVRDMEIARASADFIIVCPHWGIEYTHNENREQTQLAEFFTEQGADLIIGAHPHVIQPVKWVEASNGNRALVYYSLGNFINATSDYGAGVADRMVGAMASISIAVDSSGEAVITGYDAIPLVTQMLTGSGRITTYKLSDYNNELAVQNEVVQRDSAFSYEFCVNLSDTVLN